MDMAVRVHEDTKRYSGREAMFYISQRQEKWKNSGKF